MDVTKLFTQNDSLYLIFYCTLKCSFLSNRFENTLTFLVENYYRLTKKIKISNLPKYMMVKCFIT